MHVCGDVAAVTGTEVRTSAYATSVCVRVRSWRKFPRVAVTPLMCMRVWEMIFFSSSFFFCVNVCVPSIQRQVQHTAASAQVKVSTVLSQICFCRMESFAFSCVRTAVPVT